MAGVVSLGVIKEDKGETAGYCRNPNRKLYLQLMGKVGKHERVEVRKRNERRTRTTLTRTKAGQYNEHKSVDNNNIE